MNRSTLAVHRNPIRSRWSILFKRMSDSDQALPDDRLNPQEQEGGQAMSDGVKVLLGALGGVIVALLLAGGFSGGGMGYGMMGGSLLGMLFTLLFWALIVALLVVWIVNQTQRR